MSYLFASVIFEVLYLYSICIKYSIFVRIISKDLENKLRENLEEN